MLVATIVITLGWLLTMLSPDVGLITDRAGIVQLFQPEPSTIVFGFLGAYFFALMTIQRGYARGDLRPKTYTQITVRIFIAIIFAWVLQLLPGDDDAGVPPPACLRRRDRPGDGDRLDSRGPPRGAG